MKNKQLKILLSAPRGFCAGVERAIEIVEKSIQKYGAPVYVLVNYYVLDDAILKVIFIGLASLTFPHILLEYFLEKNEK